jgi:formylglycine-generating enzyme required for sulfatase activity
VLFLTVAVLVGCADEQAGMPGAEGEGGAGGVSAGGAGGGGSGSLALQAAQEWPLLDHGSSPCPEDMVLAAAVCVDRYEAPNEPGADPLAMQTAYDGEDWCVARGKRLCRDVEWMAACQGEAGTLYPYGDDHVTSRCNDDKVWIPPDWGVLGTWPSPAAQEEAAALYQGDPSGWREGCVSEAGAFDLTGNVAEWVVRTLPNVNDYDHVMKGCYWAGCYGGTLPNCTFVNPAHPGGYRSYEAGFRCCRDPG